MRDNVSETSTDIVPTRIGIFFVVETDDLLDDGVIFLATGAVDGIIEIDSAHRLVGRDNHDIEFVYLPELGGLGLGGTGHTRELLIHPEKVLERDGRQCLSFTLDRDAFLGLDRLVQTIGVTPAGHEASGELIDNEDFAFLHYVFDILLEQLKGAQKLVDSVILLRFLGMQLI